MTTAAPGVVTKKDLTLAQAADQWEEATLEMARLKPLRDEAAAIIKAHLEKTGRTKYKNRIALVIVPARTILDQAKVREFLGRRLGEFQKRTEPSSTLTLLED